LFIFSQAYKHIDVTLVTIIAHFDEISAFLNNGYEGCVKVHLVKVDNFKNSVDVLKQLQNNITKDIVIMQCDMVSSLSIKELTSFHKEKDSLITIVLKD